jgi:hypothetical protein
VKTLQTKLQTNQESGVQRLPPPVASTSGLLPQSLGGIIVRVRNDIELPDGRVFETTIDGKTKTVIALTGKDGLLRLFDCDSRRLVYAVPFTTRTNAAACGNAADHGLRDGILPFLLASCCVERRKPAVCLAAV